MPNDDCLSTFIGDGLLFVILTVTACFSVSLMFPVTVRVVSVGPTTPCVINALLEVKAINIL